MMGGLKPDFRTISDFRKDSIKSLKGVFREFKERVTVDLETGFVSIDGSKFKEWNSRDRSFTIMKLDDRIKWLEDHTLEYLRLIGEADKEEEKAKYWNSDGPDDPDGLGRKKNRVHYEKKKVVRFKLRPDREKTS